MKSDNIINTAEVWAILCACHVKQLRLIYCAGQNCFGGKGQTLADAGARIQGGPKK